ncbi:MAG: hypothetical protein ACLRRT_14125 [Ruthenibacterium lactatiformans]
MGKHEAPDNGNCHAAAQDRGDVVQRLEKADAADLHVQDHGNKQGEYQLAGHGDENINAGNLEAVPEVPVRRKGLDIVAQADPAQSLACSGR